MSYIERHQAARAGNSDSKYEPSQSTDHIHDLDDEQEGQRRHCALKDVLTETLRAGVAGEHCRAEQDSRRERSDDREDNDLTRRA